MTVTKSQFKARPTRGGRHIIGKGPPGSWVNVRNLGAAKDTTPGHDLYESNTFTADGNYCVEIPKACEGDTIEVLHSEPGVAVQRKLVTLSRGKDLQYRRSPSLVVHTFRLEPTDDNQLKVDSTRAQQAFGSPRHYAWFRNCRTEYVKSCRLQADGTLPNSFRLRGRMTDRFQVRLTATARKKPPRFSNRHRLAVPVRESSHFDHPAMKPMNGPLYLNGVHWDDPIQGGFSNCWFVAAVSAIAKVRPDVIEKLIEPLEDGRYRITFQKYDPAADAYVPNPVIVSDRMYSCLGFLTAGSSRSRNWDGRKEKWFPILEKAFAQLSGSYRETEYGSGHQAFEQLLGAAAVHLDHALMPEELFGFMRDAVEEGEPIYAGTVTKRKGLSMRGKLLSPIIFKRHAYTVLDVYERQGRRYVKVRDPHGNFGGMPGLGRGIINMRFEDFRDLFHSTSIGKFPADDEPAPTKE